MRRLRRRPTGEPGRCADNCHSQVGHASATVPMSNAFCVRSCTSLDFRPVYVYAGLSGKSGSFVQASVRKAADFTK